MSEYRDVFGKADALLRRHTPSRPDEVAAGDVPMLTELVTPPSMPAGGTDVPAPAAPAQRVPDEEFIRELVAQVVNAVQARLAMDLERRLTQHLVAEVQASIAATLGDLRQDIANAVGDAVADALSRRYEK
jgi:hypothetical protein